MESEKNIRDIIGCIENQDLVTNLGSGEDKGGVADNAEVHVVRCWSGVR